MNTNEVTVLSKLTLTDIEQDTEGNILKFAGGIDVVFTVDIKTKEIKLRKSVRNNLPMCAKQYGDIRPIINMGDTLTDEEVSGIPIDCAVHSFTIDRPQDNTKDDYAFVHVQGDYVFKEDSTLLLENYTVLPSEVLVIYSFNVTIPQRGRLGIQTINHSLFSNDNCTHEIADEISEGLDIQPFVNDNYDYIFNRIMHQLEGLDQLETI